MSLPQAFRMNRSRTFLEKCDCGNRTEPCVTCAHPRCARCEPYVSDDCLVDLSAAG
jgi:hypothetical protein